MDTEETLLRAILSEPADDMARLALADWLEEQDRQPHGEVLRLHVRLRHGLPEDEKRPAWERLIALITSGVRPVVPIRVNSLFMPFVLIPPGRFWMGSPGDEADRFEDEGPEREVQITQPFYLGVFPVTQGEYVKVMGANPSFFCSTGTGRERVEGIDTQRHPVENLSWDDTVAFCKVLNDVPAEKKAGRRYRLPTEAEWEYACRAGVSRTGPFHFGRGISSTQANFDGRFPYGGAEPGPYLRTTTTVDAYPPNAFGLYDLHGNVSEWCSDWFDETWYFTGPAVDPQGPETGEHRVLRGGSWGDDGKYCRAAFRYDRPPDEGRNDFGLRLLMEYRQP
jgi:sulfatase modifying factor 1